MLVIGHRCTITSHETVFHLPHYYQPINDIIHIYVHFLILLGHALVIRPEIRSLAPQSTTGFVVSGALELALGNPW